MSVNSRQAEDLGPSPEDARLVDQRLADVQHDPSSVLHPADAS